MISADGLGKLYKEFRKDALAWLKSNYPDVDPDIVEQSVSESPRWYGKRATYDGGVMVFKEDIKKKLWRILKFKVTVLMWQHKMKNPEYARLYRKHQKETSPSKIETRYREFLAKNWTKTVNTIKRNYRGLDRDAFGNRTDYHNDAQEIASDAFRQIYNRMMDPNKEEISDLEIYFYSSVVKSKIKDRRKKDSLLVSEEAKKRPFKFRLEFHDSHSPLINEDCAVPVEEYEDQFEIDSLMAFWDTSYSGSDVEDCSVAKIKDKNALIDMDVPHERSRPSTVGRSNQMYIEQYISDTKISEKDGADTNTITASYNLASASARAERQVNSPGDSFWDDVREAVDKLPPVPRKVAKLRIFAIPGELMNFDDIAKILGLKSRSTAFYHYEIARKQIIRDLDLREWGGWEFLSDSQDTGGEDDSE